jgi:hypothetical protein
VRLDALEPGQHFRIPELHITGKLIKLDREGGTSATVEIWRNGQRHAVKQITNCWGETRRFRYSATERTEWSCATSVQPLTDGSQAEFFTED